MAGKVERPIIFPLSNPYDREQLSREISFTGQTSAPDSDREEFPPVALKGRTIKIAQCNNFYIFPAIGLAVKKLQRQNE